MWVECPAPRGKGDSSAGSICNFLASRGARRARAGWWKWWMIRWSPATPNCSWCRWARG